MADSPPLPPGLQLPGPAQPVNVVQISDKEIFQNMLQELEAVHTSLDAMRESVGATARGEQPNPQGVSDLPSRAGPNNPSGGVGGVMGALGVAQSPGPGASGANITATSMLGRVGQFGQGLIGDVVPNWTPPYQQNQTPGAYGDMATQKIIDPATGKPFPGLVGSAARYAGQMAIPLAMFNARSLLGAIPGPAGMAALGSQFGTAPGSDAFTTPNILGFQARIPFGQMGTGIQQTWDSFKTGIGTPGLSTSQVMASKASLSELGWTPDKSGFGPMSDVLNSLQQQDQRLDPSVTAPLLDQATRLGATSLEDFHNVLSQIPNAAKAAQVSIGQVVQDMTALGQANQDQGGTFAQGAKLGTMWSGLTGLPATAVPALMQNPFVAAYATRSTGLMPQMQGIMGSGSRIQSIYGAINQLSNMTSFQGYSTPGGQGMWPQHFSGRQQNLAWMHSMIPEASHEMLRVMTNPHLRAGVMAGANMETNAATWARQVGQGARGALSGDPGAGKYNFGDLTAKMRMARGVDGKLMFSHDQIAAIHDLNTGSGSVQDQARRMLERSGGGTNLGSPAGHRALQQALAHQRTQMIDKDVQMQGTKAQKQQGPKYTIGLSAEARRFFNLNSRQGTAKNNAGAGAGTTNSGYEIPTSPHDFGTAMHDVGQAASDISNAASHLNPGGWIP